MTFAIIHADIFDGESMLSSHTVIIDENLIVDVIPETALPSSIKNTIDLKGDYLVPGFIDLQVNGGGGIMFNSEPSIDTIKTMAVAHRRYGTAGFMPTLITDSYEKMQQAISAVDQAITEGVPGVLGIHLEGPFLSEAKKGAHDANKFCKIDKHGFDIVTSLKKGKTIVTLAPELAENDVIRALSEQGIVICAGHSSADYQQTCEGIQAGISGFTHLYNAMTQLQSREPGMVGAALSDETTWFGIIADGYHMHPSAFKVAVSAKQPGGAILVTDAMSTVGAASKSFVLNGETITSVNGRCQNAAGSLAGSDLDMNSAIKNAIKFAAIDWQEAVRMASVYPANALGLADTIGMIKAGYNANLVQLSKSMDVVSSWVNGKAIHS